MKKVVNLLKEKSKYRKKFGGLFKGIALSLCLACAVPFAFSGCSGTNGKSAYELAVEQGYEGTLQEWLESLKGESSQNGASGSVWLTGTEISGNSANIFASIDGAKINDIYLNTETSDLYQCIAENGWKWIANIKGEQGQQGENGTSGSVWFSGTIVAGTGSANSAVVAGAVVGDYYFNTENNNVYKCTGENTWTFVVTLKGAQGQQGEQGLEGVAGRDGATWLSGATVPSDSNGNDGDFYLDTTTYNIYKKASGMWYSLGNIKGEAGEIGATGAQGAAGKDGSYFYTGGSNPTQATTGNIGDVYFNNVTNELFQKTDATTWTSIGNLQGSQGAQGEKGDQGEKGETGAQGAQGLSILSGLEDPSDANGVDGDLYLNTTSYDLFKKESGIWVKYGNIKGKDYEEQREYYTNLFDSNSEDNITGSMIIHNGETEEGSNFLTTHLIPVELNQEYIWQTVWGGLYGGNRFYIHLFDENGTWLKQVAGEVDDRGTVGSSTETSNYNDDLVTIKITDSNVKYVKLCVSVSTKDSVMFVPGTEFPERYVNYNEIVYKNPDVRLTQEEYDMLMSQNPLFNKTIAFEGDSICAGGTTQGNYANLIAENNSMTMVNNAVGGGTITQGIYSTSGELRHCILDGVKALVDAGTYDYIIFEGGVNDKSLDISTKGDNTNEDNTYVNFGTISSGYSATLDETTFCGAFESACKTLALSGKKVGYIFVHKIFDDDLWNTTYKTTMVQILEKWGIPYLDLETLVPPLNMDSTLRDTYTIESSVNAGHGDGWHPNELGYKTFYVDKITAWLKTL